MSEITAEDFEEWRENPVTRAVLDLIETKRLALIERFQSVSWEHPLSEVEWAVYREREATYSEFIALDHTDLTEDQDDE